MICPECGNNNAYATLSGKWSCVNSNCKNYDQSSITILNKPTEVPPSSSSSPVPEPEQKKIRVWQTKMRRTNDYDDADSSDISYFATEDEAERFLCDYIIDRIEDVDEDENKMEILEDIQDGNYYNAIKAFNRHNEEYEYSLDEIETETHSYDETRLRNRSEQILDELREEMDEEEECEEDDDP